MGFDSLKSGEEDEGIMVREECRHSLTNGKFSEGNRLNSCRLLHVDGRDSVDTLLLFFLSFMIFFLFTFFFLYPQTSHVACTPTFCLIRKKKQLQLPKKNILEIVLLFSKGEIMLKFYDL